MRQIGNRRQAEYLTAEAHARLLVQGAVFSQSVAHLTRSTFVLKGIYRFRTQEEANEHAVDCLSRGMAELASRRAGSITVDSP